MKAVVQEKYGPADKVLELKEVEKPLVKDNEVLVRVRAASMHPDIWHVVRGLPYVLRLMGAGLRKPKTGIPGIDLAGQVESIGRNVTEFNPGDEVFGEIDGGFQWKHCGTYAEFVAAPAGELLLKPANITFGQAAASCTSGLIALRTLLRDGNLQSGHKVLINGAGGNVGTLSIQIAKAFGAEVTGVDCAGKLELLRSLGADRVVDYEQEDFTQGSTRYDLILDVASNLKLSNCKRVLTPDGKYLLIGHDHFGESRGRVMGSLPQAFKLMAMTPFQKHLPRVSFDMDTKELFSTLKELLESGKITPIIDKTFTLSEVPRAMRYMEEGKAKGKLIIIP